jgi:hypothetical protein
VALGAAGSNVWLTYFLVAKLTRDGGFNAKTGALLRQLRSLTAQFDIPDGKTPVADERRRFRHHRRKLRMTK